MRFLILVAFLAAAVFSGCEYPSPEFSDIQVRHALQVVNELSLENYEAARDFFDEELQADWSVDQLEELWRSLTAQHGGFREVPYFMVDSADGPDQKVARVELTCLFEDGSYTITLEVTPEGSIQRFIHGDSGVGEKARVSSEG